MRVERQTLVGLAGLFFGREGQKCVRLVLALRAREPRDGAEGGDEDDADEEAPAVELSARAHASRFFGAWG